MFPAKYKNGAFIAFHGSWNRAQSPQEGYYVVFVPFKDGMPSGNWEIFADNFAGENKEPSKARFRPCGLAQGPDGSLYVSDDQKGRILENFLFNKLIEMKGILSSGILTLSIITFFVFATQPSPKDSIERGKKVYGDYCIACHQADGSGVPKMNPPLINTSYVTGDKRRLVSIVLNGLKGGEVEIDGNTYDSPMTPHDFLNDQQIADVLTYIRNSFGNKASAVSADEVKAIRSTIKK